MAEEHASRKFRLPWSMPAKRVARRESAPTPLEWRSTVHSRLLVCAVLFAAWAVGIEGRLFYLQVIAREELQAKADKQQLMTVKSPPSRGAITDRNGRLLAFSVDAFTIAVDPQTPELDVPRTVRLICDELGCRANRRLELEKEIVRLATVSKKYFEFQRDVSPDIAERIAKLKLTGVGVYPVSKRYYPNKSLAAHLLGYVGRDNKGLAGLEATYDTVVRGKEGRLLLQVDSRRQPMAVLEAVPVTAGDSLELTIDQYLQRIAERELEAGIKEHNAASGTVVIMNPRTGAILAMANFPTFNPNIYGAFSDTERKNRVIQDIYEPGSTFKVVTASAALEERVYGVSDLIDCAPGFIKLSGRKPIRDVHPYGALSFEDVIVKSSNVGAIKAGMRIGAERLSLYVNRFGFGQALSPDFRGQTAGLWRPQDLNESGLASVSMGYQIGVTPLQMAAAVSSIANGGTLYEPRLLGAIVRNGRREPVTPKALRRTVSADTAQTLTGIMEAVVERGTAQAAKIDGFTIAGKTGTAARVINGHYSDSEYHTSFIGFAPSRNPALTVIVVIDSPHGKVTAYGGTVAAPIFKRITEASLRHLGIGPSLNAPPPVLVTRADTGATLQRPDPVGVAGIRNEVMQVAQDGVMPDLRGLSSREAVLRVTGLGLLPRASGSGFVIEQSPEPGALLVPGEAALLKLARTVGKALSSSTVPAVSPRGRPQ